MSSILATPDVGRRLATLAIAGSLAGLGAAAITIPEGAKAQTQAADAAGAERASDISPFVNEEARADAIAFLEAEYGREALVIPSRHSLAAWRLIGNSIFSGGIEIGVESLLTSLLGGGDPHLTEMQKMGEALAEIQSSVHALEQDIAKVRTQAQALLSAQQWSQFRRSDEQASDKAGEIGMGVAHLSTVLRNLDDGEDPDMQDLITILNTSYMQIFELRAALFAEHSGSMNLLQRALERDISGTAWESLDTYRTQYMIVLAEAVASLDAIATWDPWLGVLAGEARKVASGLYDRLADIGTGPRTGDIGANAALGQITAPEYLHVNGADWFYASPERPLIHGEARILPSGYPNPRQPTNKNTFQFVERLQEMAAAYHSTRVDETTFEQYMAARGYRTTIPVLTDETVPYHGYSHGMTCQKDGFTLVSCKHKEIQIRGNGVSLGWSRDYSKAELTQITGWDTNNGPHYTLMMAEHFVKTVDPPYLVQGVETNDFGLALAPEWDSDIVKEGLKDVSATEGSGGWEITSAEPAGDNDRLDAQISSSGFAAGAPVELTSDVLDGNINASETDFGFPGSANEAAGSIEIADGSGVMTSETIYAYHSPSFSNSVWDVTVRELSFDVAADGNLENIHIEGSLNSPWDSQERDLIGVSGTLDHEARRLHVSTDGGGQNLVRNLRFDLSYTDQLSGTARGEKWASLDVGPPITVNGSQVGVFPLLGVPLPTRDRADVEVTYSRVGAPND